MKKLKFALICRGIPGSGKSTFARYFSSFGGIHKEKMENNILYFLDLKTDEIVGAVHSTDFYHYNENGEYKWSASNSKKFHTANYKAFRDSCEKGISIVICDNTNISKSEYEKYLQAARDNDYIVSICTMDVPTVETSVKRNIHNVPKETIHNMRKKLLQNEN